MVRNLNPIFEEELRNLDKDADSRRAAMKALKSFVKDMDSKAIPVFLAEVARNKEAGSLSGECTISLFEVLAREHRVKIVPLISNIMESIIMTMTSGAGSFPLQQACSRVVSMIARYGIDASTPEEGKRHVIHSLCNPLADSLLGSQESLTSGAVLCLKALVENDNWRFASYEMVNKVCQNVAGALQENLMQTNAHMALVMALAKRNAVAVEPYARLLVQSGLRILNTGMEQGNSQKRLSAIQMVKSLMKCLDQWSIRSELQLIINEMEKCQCDHMSYIKGAAFEALQIAKRIASESGSNSHKDPGLVTGSNFSRRDNGMRRSLSGISNRSPASASPGSHFLNSFDEYDSLIDSPILTKQDIQYLDSDCRSVDQKLWSYENGGVDVSLRDGFFSEIAQSSGVSDTFFEQSDNKSFLETKGNSEEDFLAFSRNNPRNGICKSTASSPLRSRTLINLDNNIFKTPRKFVHSLQDPNNINSEYPEKEVRMSRYHSLSDFEWSPVSGCDPHCILPNDSECGENESIYADVEQFQDGIESVSSTDDIPVDPQLQVPHQMIPEKKTSYPKAVLKCLCGLSFALLAAFTPVFLLNNQDEGCYLVPT